MAVFCSTTGKTCITQELLTLAKAIHSIVYDSKINMFISAWKNPQNRTESSLNTVSSHGCFGRWTSCAQSKGPCLGAVTCSYLCPGGYQNSMTALKTSEQRLQYDPSFQVGFKSSLGSTIIIMPVDRE